MKKTIKVIDLLSNLAKYAINIKNKRIRYFDRNNYCYDECNLKENEIIYRLYYGNLELNSEVEIIEDKSKILKELTSDELKYFEGTKELVTRLANEDIKIIVKLLLGDKYDKIIDELNKGDK